MKKYDLHEIMTTAWNFVKTKGMTLSAALKKAWKIAKLVAIGGREWENYGKHRVYFNSDAICSLCHLDIDHYKSGNISNAYLDGEHISNARAGRIISTTTYFDVVSGSFFSNGSESELILNAISAAL